MRIRQEGQYSRPLGCCCFPHRKECWTPWEGVRHIHWRSLGSRRMKEHRIRAVYCQNLTIEQSAISVTTYRRRHSIATGRCAVLAAVLATRLSAALTTPLSARLYALGLSAPGSAISLAQIQRLLPCRPSARLPRSLLLPSQSPHQALHQKFLNHRPLLARRLRPSRCHLQAQLPTCQRRRPSTLPS